MLRWPRDLDVQLPIQLYICSLLFWPPWYVLRGLGTRRFRLVRCRIYNSFTATHLSSRSICIKCIFRLICAWHWSLSECADIVPQNVAQEIPKPALIVLSILLLSF